MTQLMGFKTATSRPRGGVLSSEVFSGLHPQNLEEKKHASDFSQRKEKKKERKFMIHFRKKLIDFCFRLPQTIPSHYKSPFEVLSLT